MEVVPARMRGGMNCRILSRDPEHPGDQLEWNVLIQFRIDRVLGSVAARPSLGKHPCHTSVAML
jgi:hypothetical protein